MPPPGEHPVTVRELDARLNELRADQKAESWKLRAMIIGLAVIQLPTLVGPLVVAGWTWW